MLVFNDNESFLIEPKILGMNKIASPIIVFVLDQTVSKWPVWPNV